MTPGRVLSVASYGEIWFRRRSWPTLPLIIWSKVNAPRALALDRTTGNNGSRCGTQSQRPPFHQVYRASFPALLFVGLMFPRVRGVARDDKTGSFRVILDFKWEERRNVDPRLCCPVWGCNARLPVFTTFAALRCQWDRPWKLLIVLELIITGSLKSEFFS